MTKRQPAGHPRNSTKYKRLRAAFLRRQGRWGVCSLCGGRVDMALSGRASMGPTIDHRVPVSAGGSFYDPANWQLAHRICNGRKGRGEPIVGVGPSGRFADDGHWKFMMGERETPSPNDTARCDNPTCARCKAEYGEKGKQ